MELKKLEKRCGEIYLVIEEEILFDQGIPVIWARLDIFEGGVHVNDYLLQGGVEEAKNQAKLEFGISENDWHDAKIAYCQAEANDKKNWQGKEDVSNNADYFEKIARRIEGLTAEEMFELRDYLCSCHENEKS